MVERQKILFADHTRDPPSKGDAVFECFKWLIWIRVDDRKELGVVGRRWGRWTFGHLATLAWNLEEVIVCEERG